MGASLAKGFLRAVGVAAVGSVVFGLASSFAFAASTTTSITSSSNPSGPGESVTFDAQVTAYGGGALGGTVSFLDGSTVMGTGTLKNVGAGLPIAAGFRHTCALTTTGGVQCWGSSSYGQLGNEDYSSSNTPVDVTGLSSGAIALAAGESYTCALMTDGTVNCWGYDGEGISSYTAAPVDGLSGVKAMAAGRQHSCFLLNAGTVKCWGDNSYGQLGDGTTDSNSALVDVGGLTDVVAIGAGYYQTCAVTKAGAAKCWGRNDNGQLGDGTTTSSSVPVDVSGLSSGVAKIGGGSTHTCALMSDTTVKCWGDNSAGQLGNATVDPSLVPVNVYFFSGAAALAVGNQTTCAILGNGAAKCWGNGLAGQLGEGRNIARTTPVDVTGLDSGTVAFTVGDSHTCFVTNTGAAQCAGANNYGQLGDGTRTARNVTVPVSSLATLLFGSASLSVLPAPGLRSITARYDGDANHDTSTSDPLTQTVNAAPAITSANGVTTGVGAPLTFTITATGYPTPSLNVTGTLPSGVTFVDNGNGTGIFSGTPIFAGGYSVTITASNGIGSDAQQSFSFAVTQGASITSSSDATGSIGSPFSFTVTTGGYPAAAVTLEGRLPNGLSFTPGTGTATISGTPTTGAGGPHTVTINADNGVALATQDFEITIDRTYGLVTLSPSPNPSTAGQAVTLTANVYGQATPTGVVIFSDGAISLGIGSISGGVAVLSTSALAVGSHSLSAFYIGNDDLYPTSSTTQTLTVNKAATTTTVASNVASPVSGQPVTLTATIAVTSPGSATVTGSVTFKDGATTLGTATVSGGQAQITTSALAVGNRTVTTTYTPDGVAPLTGSSGTTSVTVNKGATTLTVSASPNPAKPGATVTLKATVVVTAPSTGTPSGSVIFKDGTKTLGSGTIASGKASVTVSSLTIGSHSITASYAGSTTLSASTGSASVTIDPKVGPEFRVNTTVAGSQQLPAVARLASNAFVVVWASNAQDGAGYGVYGQRYNANGVKLGAEFQVNTTTAKDQRQPSIAGLKDGGFVVAWQSNGEDGSGYGIYAQRYTAAGAKSGSEFKVNTTTTNQQSLPAITALAAGGFVVAWTSNAQDGSGLGIYAQRYDATAKAAGTEFKVNKTTAGDQSNPSLAGLTGGGFAIAWQSSGQDGSGLGVYAQRYDANGKALGTESRVNTVTVNDQSLPSIAALDTGGFVVAWQSALQDSSGLGVYLQRFTVTGVKAGGETLVNTWTASDQSTPSVAAFSDGGFVVTWASKGQDGSGQGIYAQLFKDTGVKVNVEFAVNTTTTGNQYQPAAAAFASGSFIAVWTSVGQDGSLEGVYAQRFLVPGAH